MSSGSNYPVGYEFWFKDIYGRVGTGILESFTWDLNLPHLRITIKYCSTEFVEIAFMDEPYKFYSKKNYDELCVKFNKELQKIEKSKMIERQILAKEKAIELISKYKNIEFECKSPAGFSYGIFKLPHSALIECCLITLDEVIDESETASREKFLNMVKQEIVEYKK